MVLYQGPVNFLAAPGQLSNIAKIRNFTVFEAMLPVRYLHVEIFQKLLWTAMGAGVGAQLFLGHPERENRADLFNDAGHNDRCVRLHIDQPHALKW